MSVQTKLLKMNLKQLKIIITALVDINIVIVRTF